MTTFNIIIVYCYDVIKFVSNNEYTYNKMRELHKL